MVTWGCYFLNGRGESENPSVEAGLDAGMGETSWAKASAASEVPGGSGVQVRQGSLGARLPAQKSHEQICKFSVPCSLVRMLVTCLADSPHQGAVSLLEPQICLDLLD